MENPNAQYRCICRRIADDLPCGVEVDQDEFFSGSFELLFQLTIGDFLDWHWAIYSDVSRTRATIHFPLITIKDKGKLLN